MEENNNAQNQKSEDNDKIKILLKKFLTSLRILIAGLFITFSIAAILNQKSDIALTFLFLGVYLLFFNTILEWSEKTKKLNNLNTKLNKTETALSNKEKEYNELSDEIFKAKEEIKNKKEEIESLEKSINDLELDSIKVVELDINLNKYNSAEIKVELNNIQAQIKELIKNDKAVDSKIKSNDKTNLFNIKQLIRSFDIESISILDNLTIANFDSKLKKLEQIKNQLNNLYKYDECSISNKFYKLKQKQLLLAHNYLKKIDDEKENRKYINEKLLEEEKVRKELEKKKNELRKEKKNFETELKRLHSYLSKAKTDIEKELYIEKITELDDKVKEIDTDILNVEDRQTNTRSGYVYIISNIGSFGENIYKIGMTRRLEPMDRINELSSASVPFKFDVHALIFTEDAPALENALHHAFEFQKVNKINHRKEFFKVDLEAIKEIVHRNYNKTVQYIDVPEAYEFRETLKLNENENLN